jgi:hypothetical protein
MPQSSGPIAQGTTAERQFTDVLWRDLFGDEPGVVGDLDGTAYKVTLPTDSDVAQVGSATQRSVARLAAFAHVIPQGETEPITVPAAVGSARTDIIALRYDPAFTGLPGPVRLALISGTSSGIPAYDASPAGVEDLPLWAVTRTPGQALSQATVQRLFPRLAPALDMPTGAPLPLSSPLGTILWQGGTRYRREMVSGSPAWVREGGNADTSGVLAGVAPPVGTALRTKTWVGNVPLNAQGDATVFYPGGTFSNGLVDVEAHVTQQAGAPASTYKIDAWNAALDRTNLRGFLLSTGQVAGGQVLGISVTATGW